MQNHVKVEQTIAQSEKFQCKTSAKLWDRLTQLHNWTKCNKCFIWETWLQYFVKQTAGSLSDLLKPGHVAPKLESYLALHRGISPVATRRSGCWSNCAKPNRQSNPRGNFEPEEELFFLLCERVTRTATDNSGGCCVAIPGQSNLFCLPPCLEPSTLDRAQPKGK